MTHSELVRLYPNAKYQTLHGIATLLSIPNIGGECDFVVTVGENQVVKQIAPDLVKPILWRYREMSDADREACFLATRLQPTRGGNFEDDCKGQPAHKILATATWLRNMNYDADNLLEFNRAIPYSDYLEKNLKDLDIMYFMENEDQLQALYDIFSPMIPEAWINMFIQIGWVNAVKRTADLYPDTITEQVREMITEQFKDFFPVFVNYHSLKRHKFFLKSKSSK